MIYDSKVNGFEGKCKPVWSNNKTFLNRIDGGVSGFFKLVVKKYGFYWKTGEEFHGIITNWNDKIVKSTEDDE